MSRERDFYEEELDGLIADDDDGDDYATVGQQNNSGYASFFGSNSDYADFF